MNPSRALLLFACLASPIALASPPAPPLRADPPAETRQPEVARQSAALRQLGAELRAAAKQPPRLAMDRVQTAKVREYNAWLGAAAERADALAAEGEALSRAGTTDAQALAFDARFRQLQGQLQQENRSHAAAAALVKTKHDTVKNAINNTR